MASPTRYRRRAVTFQEACDALQKSIYSHRVARRHSHHCDFGGHAIAGPLKRQNQSTSGSLHRELEANAARLAALHLRE